MGRNIDQYVYHLKHNQTPEEIQFFKMLQKCLVDYFPCLQHSISKQVHVRACDRSYIIDLYIGAIRLGFEIDGGYHWQSKQLDKDLQRDANLHKVGIHLIHIPNKDLTVEERTAKLQAELPFWIDRRIHWAKIWRKNNPHFKFKHGTPKRLALPPMRQLKESHE